MIGRDAGSTRIGPAQHFRTLPSSDSTAPLSFTMGSCQNYAFFMHGRDGKGDAAPATDRSLGFPTYAAMQSLAPAFFIGTGDIVYHDHPAATQAQTLPELRRRWHEQFRFPRMIEFLGNTAAFWWKDDHDFRFNDADREGNRLPATSTGIDVFREQKPLLAAGDDTSPSYRTHRPHRHLQLWFTEGCDYRSPNAQADGPEKIMWGEEQRAWLERTLLESDTTWRVIVSPTPMVGPDHARKRDNDDNAVPGVRPGTKASTDSEGRIKQPFLSSRITGGFLHVTVDEQADVARLRIAFVDDEGTLLHTNTRHNAS